MRKKILLVIMVLSIALYAEDEIAEEQVTEEKTAQEAVSKEEVSENKVDQDEKIPQEKINVAVLDLDNRGSFTVDEIKLFTDRINSEIIQIEQFIVVERQQIDKILEEQGFQQSGACNSRECMIEVGQLLSVQKVIGGSIGKLENIYPVSLKVVDIQTGEVDAQVVKDCKGSKTKLLSEYIPAITNELLQRAGYSKKVATTGKKKKIVAKPGFWIPTLTVVAGGAAVAAILLLRDEDGDEETGGEIDISDFPDHINIPIQE